MTALAVLLGHGIGYSASPAIHNAAFEALELDARYELRDVGADNLAAEVDALRSSDRIGANVTKPHKVAVCRLVDELAPEVRGLGAANTIIRYGDRLIARNTDYPALRAELPPGINRAVILGGGGASRAAVAALKAAGLPCRGGGRSSAVGQHARRGDDRGPARQRDADRHRLRRDAGAGRTCCGPRWRCSTSSTAPARPASSGRPARPAPARVAAPGCCCARPPSASHCGRIAQAPFEVMRDALRAELGPGADV